jgi:NADH-ubiquinone oxidoreductase chain 5
LIAGIAAIVECDLKKIIALSTLSQLGVIVSTLAINLPALTFFHLITHALFKALLFICAGSLIYHFSHTQDLRQIAAACPQSPTISSSILIANLALCGRPFLAGFYSKDLILEILLFNPANTLIILIFLAATILTAAYSTRLLIILL